MVAAGEPPGPSTHSLATPPASTGVWTVPSGSGAPTVMSSISCRRARMSISCGNGGEFRNMFTMVPSSVLGMVPGM